jgi:hypothetical protein
VIFVLSFVFRSHKVPKVVVICAVGAGRELSIQIVTMIASINHVVVRFEQRRVVTRSPRFVPARDRTVETTAMFPLVTNESIEVLEESHSWPIRGAKEKKWLRGKYNIPVCIPDLQPFPL